MTTENITEAGNTGKEAPLDIIAEIKNYLCDYMAFSTDDQAFVLALWVLHTHTFAPDFPRAPWTTPYLYIYSDEPGCGKSLLLDLLEGVCREAVKAGSMSASAMYRLIEAQSPTIMIDEIDTVYRGGGGNGPAKYEDLRNTLNTGYKHGGYTYRTEGLEPVKFRTFGAKILAGIRDDKAEIPTTVLTRSIRIHLERKRPDQKTKVYYSFQAGPIAEELAELASGWVKINALKIADHMPDPGEFQNRDFELAMPLLQIAHAAGCEQEAREALTRIMAPEPAKETEEQKVFRTIRDMFDSWETDVLFTADITEALNGMTGIKLAKSFLRPRGIEGGNFIERNGRKGRGYWRHQFVDTFNKMGL